MRPLTGISSLLLAFAQIFEAQAEVLSAESEQLSGGIERRASNNVTIPSAISIPPSQYWDGNDGPWSSFGIQMGGGSSSQNLRVFASTAGYNTWAIGPAGCPDGYVTDCANKRGFLYNNNRSLTYVPNSIFATGIEANLGLLSSAPSGYDTVTLGWQGQGGPTVEHSVVFNVYDPNFWLGIFGLNPQPTNFTNMASPQPSFMQLLYDKGGIPSRAYGYTAGNQYRLSKVYGSLTIGGYDQNRFISNRAVSFRMYADISRDLLVDITSITTDGGGSTSNLLPGGKISAYIDSTIAQLWLPEQACKAFESAFGLSYNSTTNLYLLDGNTHQTLVTKNPNVTFTLNNGNQDVAIVLPYAAFNLNISFPYVSSSTYYFPLRRAANDTQYTLGRTFLQEAYLIADYDRSNFTVAPCNWNQSSIENSSIKNVLSPNLTAIAAQQNGSASSGLSTGAVVGIVVAIVVLVIAAAIIITIVVMRKRRRGRQRIAELEDKSEGAALKDMSGEHRIDAKHNERGELGDGEIRELYAPNTVKPQEMESPYKMDPSQQGYSEMAGSGYFGHGKGGSHEVDGSVPVFEMPGSDVQEMPAVSSKPHQPGDPPDKIR